MNITGLVMLLAIVAIFFIWILLKPKKTERKRFNLRERRLKREEERETNDED